MTAEMVARTIQLILAPVVMVTACAIMLGGMLGHYAAINDRLRAMARERLNLLHGDTARALAVERLSEIDVQMPDLLHRHQLVRNSVLVVYCAILIFIADMFVIAAAAVTNAAWLAGWVLVVFLIGTSAMMLGVLFITLEVRASHRAVQYEAQRVLSLGKQV